MSCGVSWLPKPAVMNRPSPGPAMIAAMVAVAMTWAVAMRSPATTSGTASGSSTRKRTCGPVRPIPRAASTRSASTARMPA